MLWVKDRLGENPRSYEWSKYGGAYANHEWDGDEDPLAAFWNVVANAYKQSSEGMLPDYRIAGLEAATGTGKTFLLARIVYWFLDCFPNSLVITSAPTQAQMKIGLWGEISKLMPKVKRHHPTANLYSMRLMMKDTTAMMASTSVNKEYEDDFFDGWKAMAYVAGTTQDEESAVKARGLHRKQMLIVLEECSGMPWSVVNAFQNTCTGSMNYIIAVGNPNNKQDSLNLLIRQKNAKGFRVSAYDHPNLVLKEEVIAGAVSYVSVKDREDVYGKDSLLYDAMVRGISPEQSNAALIKGEWIDWADMHGDKFDPKDESELDQDSYDAVGIDVSNSENGDKACVIYGDGNRVWFVKEFFCPNASHLAMNFMEDDFTLEDEGVSVFGLPKFDDHPVHPECVGVDAVGVGISTVNKFLEYQYDVVALMGGGSQMDEAVPEDDNGKPVYKFQNLRSQMYWQLREDFRHRNIILDIPDRELYKRVKNELMIPQFIMSDKAISIEGKQHIKKRLGKSPNVADGIVYWNWVRLGHYFEYGGLGIG